MKRRKLLGIGFVLAAAGITSSAVGEQHAEEKGRQAMFEIPAALKIEHEKLHADL
jgi:hypothetical protein